MKALEELSHDSFYNMQNYSQITIDYIQKAEDILENERDKKELEALNYRISTIIDVLDPLMIDDCQAFFSLYEIIDNYLKDV